MENRTIIGAIQASLLLRKRLKEICSIYFVNQGVRAAWGTKSTLALGDQSSGMCARALSKTLKPLFDLSIISCQNEERVIPTLHKPNPLLD